MIYKVGDVVTIAPKPEHFANNHMIEPSWVQGMDATVGKVGVIGQVSPSRDNRYRVDFADATCWYYAGHWLLPEGIICIELDD